MMLAQKYMRPVALKRPREAGEGEGYQETGIIQAIIQPLTGATAAQMYGTRLTETRLLLALPEVELAVGMGVCVDVEPEDWPDWRVVYVAAWSQHTVAHIQYIPSWERVARHEN